MKRNYRKPLGGPSDHRHGTELGYSYYMCRCDPCKEAHRESHNGWRQGPVNIHGPGGYEKGCRCGTCSGAKTRQNKSTVERARKLAAAPRFDLSVLA
jgi:hypothetical protein